MSSQTMAERPMSPLGRSPVGHAAGVSAPDSDEPSLLDASTAQLERMFRLAPSAQRIEFLSAFLYACNAYEIRYLSSIVEDLASMDAINLHHEAEVANTAQTLQAQVATDGILSVLHKLPQYIPLLKRNSYACSELMTQLLLVPGSHADELGGWCDMCQYSLHMALSHPAFCARQRAKLHTLLCEMNQRQKETPRIRKASVLADPRPKKEDTAPTTSLMLNAREASISNTMINANREYAFVMDIHWSNDMKTKCHRTYEDFYKLNSALQDVFPEDCSGPNRIIPPLPGKKIITLKNKAEIAAGRVPHLQGYITSLIKLPARISQSKLILQFLSSCTLCVQSSTGCAAGCDVSAMALNRHHSSASSITSTPSKTKKKEKQLRKRASSPARDAVSTLVPRQSRSRPMSTTSNDESFDDDWSSSRLDDSNPSTPFRHHSHGRSVSVVSLNSVGNDSNADAADSVSIASTTSTLSVSVAKVCLLCRSETHTALVCEEKASALSVRDMQIMLEEMACYVPPNLSAETLRLFIQQYAWLKLNRLHKYSPHLIGLTRTEILAFTESNLKDMGVTIGACKKFLMKVQADKEANTLPWSDSYKSVGHSQPRRSSRDIDDMLEEADEKGDVGYSGPLSPPVTPHTPPASPQKHSTSYSSTLPTPLPATSFSPSLADSTPTVQNTSSMDGQIAVMPSFSQAFFLSQQQQPQQVQHQHLELQQQMLIHQQRLQHPRPPRAAVSTPAALIAPSVPLGQPLSCYRCGDFGHIGQFCPAPPRPADSQLALDFNIAKNEDE
eukprot:m.310177 g.310177  ORF g.310177 m.310177 type:complete len:785 (-) comp55349_c0_seq1:175-2529(-)